EEALALAAGNRRSEAFVMSYLAELEALNGDFAHARKLCSKARAMLEDAGAGVHASSISTFSGPVELLAEDPAGAEEELRRVFEACGDPAEAKELLAQALALYERKQAPVPAEQVRMQLARTAAAAAPALP